MIYSKYSIPEYCRESKALVCHMFNPFNVENVVISISISLSFLWYQLVPFVSASMYAKKKKKPCIFHAKCHLNTGA